MYYGIGVTTLRAREIGELCPLIGNRVVTIKIVEICYLCGGSTEQVTVPAN
jgi:hypothetical protein